MTLKPKGWGDVLAILGIVGVIISAFIGGAKIYATASNIQDIVNENKSTLETNVLTMAQMRADLQEIEIDIDALQNDAVEVIFVDLEGGYMVQRLSVEHGGLVVKIPITKHP